MTRHPWQDGVRKRGGSVCERLVPAAHRDSGPFPGAPALAYENLLKPRERAKGAAAKEKNLSGLPCLPRCPCPVNRLPGVSRPLPLTTTRTRPRARNSSSPPALDLASGGRTAQEGVNGGQQRLLLPARQTLDQFQPLHDPAAVLAGRLDGERFRRLQQLLNGNAEGSSETKSYLYARINAAVGRSRVADGSPKSAARTRCAWRAAFRELPFRPRRALLSCDAPLRLHNRSTSLLRGCTGESFFLGRPAPSPVPSAYCRTCRASGDSPGRHSTRRRPGDRLPRIGWNRKARTGAARMGRTAERGNGARGR